MAVSSICPMNLAIPSKPIQELIKSTTEKVVPETYKIQQLPNISEDNNNHSEIEYMKSPSIDLGLLSDASSSQHEQELRKLGSVLNSWGCLQLINHGLDSSLLDKIREVGKEFFALSLEQKQKHSRTLDWFEGYGGDTISEGQIYNWNDRLHLRVYPVDQRNFNFWPEYIPNFRETLEEYAVEVRRVTKSLLKAIAKSVELDEDSFLKECGEDEAMNLFTRFNYYPPCSTPERVIGLKPHSDGTVVTILQQNKQVEGLQALKDDKWFKVPIVPYALFINIGDQLEMMSNGKLKSVVHKVVIDKEKERISIATVCTPIHTFTKRYKIYTP
ncbi:protein SRG1-like [Chenopodium quinoa]|uniref:protein SRG1-like n=1 Tax=Chenopodium quinoa TaxID=63459 RepID=UPI000B7775EF|nr:protein SRG1-like [Chenopodium quinoa]